jgi:hypothetical protein
VKTLSLLEAAIAYTRIGLGVLPLTLDKKPTVRKWEHLKTIRFTDDVSLNAWFGSLRLPRTLGIGIILGKISGDLACRDFDDAGAYRVWAEKHPELAASLPTVKTFRGYHVYFRCPHLRTEHFDDGELRGEGHYCVAPPSRHSAGMVYEWVNPLTDTALQTLDPVAVGLVGEPKRKKPADPVLPATERIERNEQTESPERSEHLEQAENTEAVVALCEKNPELAEFIENAIRKSLPSKPGSRNFRIFQFARELKAHPSLRGLGAGAFREVVKEWHRRAAPVILTQDFLTTWADFGVGWGRVKWAAGEGPLDEAERRAREVPPPACAAMYELPSHKFLVSLCWQLQQLNQNSVFFLSARDAGRFCEVDCSTASRWLKAFCIDRVLTLAERGNRHGGKANRYRFIGKVE